MNRFFKTMMIAAILLLVTETGHTELDYAIKLLTGDIETIRTRTLPAQTTDWKGKHILIQFDGPITDDDKARLQDRGIQILDYVPHYAYTCRLEVAASHVLLEENDIRWMGAIQPDRKISPMISEMGIGEWARRDGDHVQFAVVLHRDENIAYWSDRFENDFGAEIIGYVPSINMIELVVPEQAMYRLSEEDAVLWIEQDMPPPEIHNNGCRENLGADVLQAAPYGLAGNGVWLGEWDEGRADLEHIDLGSVISGDGSAFSGHATHVAGTVLGAGIQNSNYKGMAPGAQLITRQWWFNTSEMEAEYQSAITSAGMYIATNSWGYGVGDPATQFNCENTLGNYFTEDAAIDNLVRGSAGGPVIILYSAGNQRGTSSKYCGSIGWTWNTIGPLGTSKNVIAVGAVNSNDNSMTSFSSWGPTDDGRVKPDVVGPGCQQGSDWGVTSCRIGGGYTVKCGTSMSTPAVAGIIALMREQYDISFGGAPPLPSTIKGILVNTATDLGNPGPDYRYGHGGVNALAACDKIAIGEPSYIEDAISTGEQITYLLTVPGNADRLKVTLVWDDPGSTSGSSVNLINDLDLVLVDPLDSEQYPWTLDPAIPDANSSRGQDHLNNVLTVEVEDPTSGFWTARVEGYNIPVGPQNFSLIFSPDSIYLPDNTYALALFDSGDITEDPGQTAPIEFWITNVGYSSDSVIVQIYDDVGWMQESIVDSVVYLDPYDSAHILLTALVPAEALAGDQCTITAEATSLTSSFIQAANEVIITAAAIYNFALTEPPEDTAASPDTVIVDVTVSNLGNITDQITVTTSDNFGWVFEPEYEVVELAVGIDTVLSFAIIIPAEELHLSTNVISLEALSTGGAGDTVVFTMFIDNPVPPPMLVSPANETFTSDRLSAFVWDGNGDNYTLYIADDSLITSIVRVYPDLTTESFTPPAGDSLDDGFYFWAVRQYLGPDSSSVQRYPFSLAVDNTPPAALVPVSPIGGYETHKLFTLVVEPEDPIPDVVAPEYNIFMLAENTDFTSGVIVYEPVSEYSFQIPDILAEGRWFWRAERVDLTGNSSGLTTTSTFVLDTEYPPVPAPLQPNSGSVTGGDTIVYSWSTASPPSYETSPEYYYIHIGAVPPFSGPNVYYGYVYADSAVLSTSGMILGDYYYWRVKALDSAGFFSDYCDPVEFQYANFICGDVDGNGTNPDVGDLTHLIGFLFLDGPDPIPYASGAVDCDQEIDISDLTWLIAYLFIQGPDPCCTY